ncbi:MAG: dTDP-4-dehydrorhamnose reductase [Ferruginibacter sp.]|nr:dTDP-4-dehydrorhamnose reductase [Ferruginibacter sp.]MCB0709125.1 dTDP-4-dehydrorhamnose reductase [Chitinophagaceae bacterium]
MTDKLLTILVTGAEGQLGKQLKLLAPKFPYCQFLFATKKELDITNAHSVKNYFSGHSIDYCINCAAYTAVDLAEKNKDEAFLLNADAVATLAAVCEKRNTQLIHISTDYVFSGKLKKAYTELDDTDPINVYGQSKLKGEKLVLQNAPSAIIIRTSWLYSPFGNNFLLTMLRLMNEKESINVVDDQWGCPTYAGDLALAIMRIIKSGKSRIYTGIFNYTNSDATTWYQFAKAIKELSNNNCIINPIKTSDYPTTAKRPAYSVLDCTKILEAYQSVSIRNWKDGLRSCLAAI